MTGVEFGTSARPRPPGRALKVLVIENDERLRLDLCTFVRGRGHEVGAVATAEAAARLARVQSPDVVLMDEAALAAARYFRLGGNAPWLILMAASLDASQREQGRALAIHQVLRKPLRADALAGILDRRRPT